MTITAVWPISSPGDVNAGDGLTVTESTELDGLVTRLAEPNAGAATIWHEGREPADPETGMLDHDVLAAIDGGYGYLSYIDTEHDLAVLDGDADSPSLSVEDLDFPAGSGVSVEVFTAALREFLDTGSRPESVTWREVDW